MDLFNEYVRSTRRQFFTGGANLMGTAAMASLLGPLASADEGKSDFRIGPHFIPKAKQVIYLHMVGGPAQMDLFDYKPQMLAMYDKDLPDSIRNGQRLTTMTSGQARFPIAPSKYKFNRAGKCGMTITENLPYLSKVADDICWIKSMHTEAINHEPAICACRPAAGDRPSLPGSWASYGLGSMNSNLPTFVVLVAIPSNREQEQAISGRLWSSGFLSGEHAGVSFRSAGDRSSTSTIRPASRRRPPRDADGVRELNDLNYQRRDPETQTRTSQYEMAFRMQASVPELTSLARAGITFKLYGEDAKKPGSFANTVLMSRRLVERGVRSSRSITTTGTTTETSAAACRHSARTSTRPAPA